MLLGVLGGGNFIGLAVNIDFDTFPFVDLTGRHTVTNIAGVTQVSGKANFTNPAGQALKVSGRTKDFNMQKDFDFTCNVKVDTITGTDKVLFEFFEAANPPMGSHFTCFLANGNGTLRTYFRQAVTQIYADSSSTGYFIPAGVEVAIKIERRGSTVKTYVDGIVRSTITTLTARTNVWRDLYLSDPTYGFVGTMDNFKYETFP